VALLEQLDLEETMEMTLHLDQLHQQEVGEDVVIHIQPQQQVVLVEVEQVLLEQQVEQETHHQ
tara:strand:- start:506 stop:694 length:189 start_codon:yes stop_codon:yes gene_type:complete